MTRAHNHIDISDEPALLRLVEQVRAIGEPFQLICDDEELAVIVPTSSARTEHQGKRPTRAAIQAVEASCGGWKGLVDGDELKRWIADGRGSCRRPVES